MPLQYSGPFFLCQQSLTLSVWQISRLLNAGEGERISNLIQDSSSPHKIYQSRVQLNLSQFNCSVRTAASLYPNISGIWRTLLKRKKTITNWDCKEYMVNMYFLSSLWNKKENPHIPPSACVVLPWLSSAVQLASCFLPGQHQPERGQFRKKLSFCQWDENRNKVEAVFAALPSSSSLSSSSSSSSSQLPMSSSWSAVRELCTSASAQRAAVRQANPQREHGNQPRKQNTETRELAL